MKSARKKELERMGIKQTIPAESKVKTKAEPKFYEMDQTIKTRVCYICGEEKGIEAFGKDKYVKGGYSKYCKECFKRRWQDKDPAYAGKHYRKVN